MKKTLGCLRRADQDFKLLQDAAAKSPLLIPAVQ